MRKNNIDKFTWSCNRHFKKIENIKFRYEREKFCQYNVAINELEFKNDKFKIIRLADINYLNK